MKFFKYLITGALLALTVTAFADVDIVPDKAVPSSFRGSVLDALNQVKNEGTLLQRVARYTFDTSVDGSAVGAYTLGAKLPDGALITRSFIYIDTQFTDDVSATGTVAISCEDANNLFTATDITGSAADSLLAGAIDDDAITSAVKAISSDCSITATIAGGTQTAGKLTGWVEYVVHD